MALSRPRDKDRRATSRVLGTRARSGHSVAEREGPMAKLLIDQIIQYELKSPGPPNPTEGKI